MSGGARLVVALVVLATALVDVPAVAQSCPAPGGAGLVAAAPLPRAEVAFSGRGWGHGVGMSQHGANGAARLGCTAPEILAGYYPGTAISAARPTPIRVGLAEATRVASVEAVGAPLSWERCASSGCEPLAVPQPRGATWHAAVEDGRTLVRDGAGVAHADVDAATVLRVGLGGVARVTWDGGGGRYGRGRIEVVGGAVTEGGEGALTAVAELPDLNSYLYGLAEVPSSFEIEALRAQAVAARTYAYTRRLAFSGARAGCRCDVYATVRDQAYRGDEQEAADRAIGGRWVAAVDATADQVVVFDGRPITAFYASSHGGSSEGSAFVFGGDGASYLVPVDDSRWEAASDNPNRTWSVGFTAAEVGAAVGVGTVTRIMVGTPRGTSGRVGDPARGAGGVRVEGTAGVVTLSGGALRSALGLRSTWFDVRGPSDAVVRISGPDRVATAVAVSRRGWASSGEAVLATAGDWPDALAAAPLAARLDAPVLLTARDALPPAVAAELDRLRVQRVTVLGGRAAVADAVLDALRAGGRDVRRLSGADRYATAAAVAAAAAPSRGAPVTLVSGEGWPDALAAGALAATPEAPVVLLSRRDALPAPTREALADLEGGEVVVVGGTAVVGDDVVDEVRDNGHAVRRLAGPSRWDTTAAVVREVAGRVAPGAPLVAASGAVPFDGLAASALAAQLGGPLVLVPPDDLAATPQVTAAIDAAAPSYGLLVGGRAAVTDHVDAQLDAAVA